jgi:hypothetical protein
LPGGWKEECGRPPGKIACQSKQGSTVLQPLQRAASAFEFNNDRFGVNLILNLRADGSEELHGLLGFLPPTRPVRDQWIAGSETIEPQQFLGILKDLAGLSREI